MKRQLLKLAITALVFTSLHGYAQEDLTMEDVDKLSLEDILDVNVVTATKMKKEGLLDAPAVVTIITAQEIERFGALSLKQVLERSNGLYVTGSGLYRNNPVVMRGDLATHMNNHVLFLINGRPHRESNFGGFDNAIIKSFPLEAIDRVEIIRGPGSVFYGTNAFTGVINIITKKKVKNSKFTAGLGSHEAKRLNGVMGTPNSLAAFHMHDDDGPDLAFKDELNVEGEYKYFTSDLGGFFSYNEGGFSLNTFMGSLRERAVGTHERLPPNNKLSQRRVFIDLGYEAEYTETTRGSYNLTTNFHQTDVDYDTNTSDEEQIADDVLFETTQFIGITDKLNLIAGGLVSHNTAESTNFRKDLKEDVYSLYTQLQAGPFAYTNFHLGVQGNKMPALDWEFVPRAGVIFNLENRWGLKLLHGGAFRSPAAGERYLNAGTAVQGVEDLKPEKVATTDVQVLYNEQNVQTSVTWFHSKYTDIITREAGTCNGIASNCYVNKGERTITGWEWDTKWLPVDRAIINLGVTYQENEQDGVENAALSPNFIYKLGVSYAFENGIGFGVYDMFYSEVRREIGSVHRDNPGAGEYHWVTANIQANMDKLAGWKGSSIELYADNLLNEEVHHPAFNRKLVNTLPVAEGAAYYVQFSQRF